ncbi:hypothetical protein [Stenotrophomonas maltophilia]|uniref:hypothetical protein n=1 Tax=Stenotrophomonas maltophilia TaxID=40324 RepID=UPI0011091161|nr:hypothetical protein [Stenotrophomonas maltophilia]MCU1051147.1 hypothetical protein [Stenotrophomonas maltophilia]
MQTTNPTPWFSDYLSLIGFAVTIIGFVVTIIVSSRAKKAADLAKESAVAATSAMRRLDVIADIATVLQLIEELKRLQRSGAFDLLPERYSGVRSRVILIRESGMVSTEPNMSALQDVVSRVSALEQAYDGDGCFLNQSGRLVKSNKSLSICSESLIGLTERIKRGEVI